MKLEHSSGIMIDKKMMRFVQSFEKWKDNIYSVYISDVDETFWFDDKANVQEFLNLQVVERFYDGELKKGYFDYINDHQEIERYFIKKLNRGKIVEFETKIITMETTDEN